MKRWSLTRENYKYWYNQLRRDGVYLSDVYAAHHNPEIAPSKALRSFENRDHYFLGWRNVERWREWQDGIYNRWPEDEVYN